VRGYYSCEMRERPGCERASGRLDPGAIQELPGERGCGEREWRVGARLDRRALKERPRGGVSALFSGSVTGALGGSGETGGVSRRDFVFGVAEGGGLVV
jgi:hypothetical protein